MLSKRVISIFAFIFITLIILSSCAPNAVTDPEATADLTIVASIPDSRASRTIQPGIDSVVPDRLVVELSGSEDKIGDFTYEDGKESYTLTNVKVGSYTIKVTGYASYEIAGKKTDAKVMYGESSYTVTANGANSCPVELEFGTDGTGAISAMITWTDLASGNSPVADAMRNGSIGFLAYYTKNNEPVIGEDKSSDDLEAIIHWVDTEKGEYQYFEDGIPATGKTAEDIYFLIYTKNEEDQISVVGKTFYSTLTVYSNVISIPDKNELYNFHLDSSNVQGYLLNVTYVKAVPSETDPSGTLIVTWTNPDFSDNVYPMTVTVTLKEETADEGGYSAANVEKFNTKASEGKTEFSGLNPNKTYSIYFKINGAIGYSLEELKLEHARTQGVTAIAFSSELEESYTVGDTVTVTASITPSAADQSAFTIIETNSSPDASIDNEAHTITFNKHGDYSFKLVAREKESIESDVKTTTVRLNAPLAVEAEAKENVEITWDAVENATGYKIYRNGSAEPIDTVKENKYTDTAAIAGETYTYSVAASAGDAKYDSEATASNEVTTAGAFISIELPKLPQDDITSYLEPVKGKYLNLIDADSSNDSFSIGLENSIEGATAYVWLLNGEEIKRTTDHALASVSISSVTPGFISRSGYNVNTLILKVETEDGPISGIVNFYVINDVLKTLESIVDEDSDSKINYKEKEQLSLIFSGEGTTPPVMWTSSDNEIATVSSEGAVTGISSGTVTITATVGATGDFIQKEITIYNFASDLSIENPAHVLIVKKAGVDVDDSYSKISISAKPIGAESGKATTSNVSWRIVSGDNLATIKDNGDNTATISSLDVEGGGTVTVEAKIDGITKTTDITIIDFDIYEEKNRITGTNHPLKGGSWTGKDYNLSLSISPSEFNSEKAFEELGFSAEWCFSGESGYRQEGLGGSTENKITSNNFTAVLNRDANLVQQAPDIDVTALINASGEHIATVKFRAIDA